jgi:hypothetical protein
LHFYLVLISLNLPILLRRKQLFLDYGITNPNKVICFSRHCDRLGLFGLCFAKLEFARNNTELLYFSRFYNRFRLACFNQNSPLEIPRCRFRHIYFLGFAPIWRRSGNFVGCRRSLLFVLAILQQKNYHSF